MFIETSVYYLSCNPCLINGTRTYLGDMFGAPIRAGKDQMIKWAEADGWTVVVDAKTGQIWVECPSHA